jgi:hypothetical protein
MVWAAGTTAYIVPGTVLEERDLIARFGAAYRRYAAEIPAFIPWMLFASARSRAKLLPHSLKRRLPIPLNMRIRHRLGHPLIARRDRVP